MGIRLIKYAVDPSSDRLYQQELLVFNAPCRSDQRPKIESDISFMPAKSGVIFD